MAIKKSKYKKLRYFLVIFEGLDNCGKTTLVQMIKDYYLELGVDSEISKEFETNIGRELKNMAKEGTLDPILKAYLFATDRYIRMKNITQEDLKPTGDTIVTEPIKDNDNSKVKDKKEEFKPKQLDKPFFQAKDNTSDIDVIKKEHEKDMDTDFFTSSYQFSKNDFADDDFYNDDKSHNILKILVLILAILVSIGVICYFVLNFGMGT